MGQFELARNVCDRVTAHDRVPDQLGRSLGQILKPTFSPANVNISNHNSTMGRVKPWKSDSEREKSIHLAKKDYLAGIEPSITSAASIYGLSYSTLRDRLQGT
jgi:hypothetical protein